MSDSPVSCNSLELIGILHEHARHFGVLGIFGFGCAEKRLKGEESGSDSEDWRPSGAKSVEADGALQESADAVAGEEAPYSLRADIWMPELCLKEHDWRPEWIFVRKLDVYHVCSALVWGVRRTRERG